MSYPNDPSTTRPSPALVHQQISQLRPPQNRHTYWVFTDGSGHQDGLGGAAAVVVGFRFGLGIHYRWLAATGTSVERMEMEALLMGLQMVEELEASVGKAEVDLERRRIWWVSDREHIVLAAWRYPNGQPNEAPFYRRRTMPDLWRRFEYYEERMIITPIWTSRNHNTMQAEADELAGFGRTCAKEAFQKIISILSPGAEATHEPPTKRRKKRT